MIPMKPIDQALKKWMESNDRFKENYDKLKQNILQDPAIQRFMSEQDGLTNAIIEKNINTLYEYKNQSINCANCPSLGQCKNILQGYYPTLTLQDETIHLSYVKCRRQKMQEKQQKQEQLFKSLYIPEEILRATYDDIDPDVKNRGEAIKEISRFIDELDDGIPQKGIYFSGPFGIGKTFMLGAVANKIKAYERSTMIVYMPEFVREMRSSIQDQTTDEKIEVFKQVDILMLDDIGAEITSAWFRDEILGSILQYRMMYQLPVFFTSNYTMQELEGELAKSTSGNIEELKAGRIMERIREVSVEAKMGGENRRRNRQ